MDEFRSTEFAPAERRPLDECQKQWDELAARSVGLLLDTVPIGMVILNGYRQIVFANEAFRSILGCPDHRQLAGTRLGEAVSCAHARSRAGGCGTTEFCRECGAARAILASHAGTPAVHECQISLESGEAVDLEVHARPFDVDGTTFTMVSVLDISGEKRRQVLERVFFDEILGTAGGLCGVANLLSNTMSNGRRIDHLVQTARRLSSQIVEEIETQKDIAAAEAAALTPVPEEIESRAFLEDVLRTCKLHDVARGKTLGLAPSPPSFPFVSDRVLLKRVLGYLIRNALEASTPLEPVTLRCLEERLGEGPGSERVVILEVHNHAVMPRSTQLQVFKRSFSTRGTGRGMGLYSARLLTEQHLEGIVSYTTAEAEGTTFRVTLPETLSESSRRQPGGASTNLLRPEPRRDPGFHQAD